MRYSSKQEAIERGIVTPLDAENPENYDLDAIFHAAFGWRIDHDDDGNERLNSAGFEQIVDADEFWQIVEHNEK